jgi:hypothetical protein
MLQEKMTAGLWNGCKEFFFKSEHIFRSNFLRHSLKVVEYLTTSPKTIVVTIAAVITKNLE